MSAKRSPATEQRYLREAEHFLRWYRTSYGAAMTAQEFTDETLERYFAWCRPRCSPSTQRRRRSALRWFEHHWFVTLSEAKGLVFSGENEAPHYVRDDNA